MFTDINKTPLEQRFQKLFQNGKLVQVHVSQWSMTYALSDTDLKLEEAPPQFATLGKKKLMPDEVRLKFKRLEASARSFLSTNSFKFPIADAHFVPHKKVIEVVLQLNKFREEFYKEVDAFLTNYEKYKQEFLNSFPEHRTSLEPFYPPVADLRAKFSFSVDVYETAVPSALKSLKMEDLVAQNIAVEASQKKFEAQMQAQYQESVRQMENFVREANIALRTKVVETFQTVADKIRNKEVVTATNVKSLRNIIHQFDDLDFFDDNEVQAKLAEVKNLVREGADFKDDATAVAALETAVNQVLTVAANVTDVDSVTGRYFRKLNI